MASRTVWIVGGLVVAIGAIAYLSYNKAPAGKDAAGTIVEAKRARADGTNSFNPTPTASTTDQNASDASKAMAGPDAAKDAAGAAGGSGDNLRLGQQRADEAKAAATAAGSAGDNGRKGMDGKKMNLRTSDSADAATAAGSGASDNIHNKARLDAAKAADSAAAARGINSSAQVIRSNASAKPAAMASQTSAMDGADKH
jgi:hypothetical protein